MNKVVLDSSALIAFINRESGAELVEKYLPNAVMSCVNVAEVVAVLCLVDVPEIVIRNIINDLNIEIISFDQEQALQAGLLRKKTKAAGLSLGDRACITLSSIKNLTLVTANKIWSSLGLTNNIILIR